MRIAKLQDFLVRSYNDPKTRMYTVFIEGPSGIGKSDVIRQTSMALSRTVENWAGLIDLRLSQCDTTDLRGVPSITSDGRTTWNIPDFFPRKNTAGIFFMDEVTSASPAMQAVAYQVALDRLHMPEGWMVIAAGNRQSDKGITFNMAAPLTNRMTKLEVDAELDGFQMHAAKCQIRPEIMAFLQERAEFLHKFDGKMAGAQFPTPRGWFRASAHLDLCTDPSERVEVLNGDVGAEAAATFEAFLRVWETMPKLAAIYKDPDNVKIPDKLDVKHCVVMGIAATVDVKTFENAYKYLARMPAEFQTLAVKLAHQRDPDISKAAGFVEWALANQRVFQRS